MKKYVECKKCGAKTVYINGDRIELSDGGYIFNKTIKKCIKHKFVEKNV